ncbi:unnamed protein product [Ilex paraguariensis]|uniref:Uncharacterized protein n=1 Tax=Ilex paraguariensis TaxID=185542 RepID=A0ABC8UH24_9AQUA
MPVGLTSEHGYTRSLARFAANLGPVAWKIASKKIESVLPPGLKFGPGWVGENEASLQPLSFSSEKQKASTDVLRDGHPSRSVTASSFGVNSLPAYQSSLLDREHMVEAASRVNSQNELTVVTSGVSGIIRPGTSQQTQQKSLLHADRNGINGALGYELLPKTGMARSSLRTGQSGLEEASESYQLLGRVSRSDTPSTHPGPTEHIDSDSMSGSLGRLNPRNARSPDGGSNSHATPEFGFSGKLSQQVFSPHHRQHSLPDPPDLNVRFQAPSSPSSSLQIGSPKQPDLALQL